MSRVTVALAAAGLVAMGGVVVAARRAKEAVPCASGFARVGARCCPLSDRTATASRTTDADDRCPSDGVARCPSPLVSTEHGCDRAEDDVVEVPAMSIVVGPSDWEAEGRVVPRVVRVNAFQIDRLEVTIGRACASSVFEDAELCRDDRRDPARAAYGVTLDRARRFCRLRHGELPTDDQWIAAAAGNEARRYPWGDTGAVCRRAAWGLESGPCAEGGHGPDTVGAHPDGATRLGIHDLAGNVSEWVEGACSNVAEGSCRGGGAALVRGGSWKTTLATDLRTWQSRSASSDVEDPTIGFRCAYDRVR